jgi:hypothetical protein
MKTLRKESREALQFVIDQGGSATCAHYSQAASKSVDHIGETFGRLLKRGILKRERVGKDYIYSVTDMNFAQEMASKLPREDSARIRAKEAGEARSRELPHYPLPCSFVFNLGANA